MEEKKPYKLKKSENEITKDLDERHKKALDEIRKLDELNPLEQAIKYTAVKRNLPKSDYMKVEMFEEKDEKGEPLIVSESTQKEGETKKIKHGPFYVVDLNIALMANIAACPSNVVPMLIDQAQRLAVDKMKTFKPEKRVKEFNYWWIVFVILIAAPFIPIIMLFL